MNVLDDIRKTTVKLLIHESFYGHFFTHIQRSISEEVKRVSVSVTENHNIILLINPKYWQSLQTCEQKMGCLKHQILHLIFKHVYRVSFFGNKEIFHIAADLVVNQYLLQSQLTQDAICLENFTVLNLLPHQTVDYYYTKLAAQYDTPEIQNIIQDDADEPGNTACEKPPDEHQDWEKINNQEGAVKQLIQATIEMYIDNSAKRINTQEFGLLPAELQTLLTAVAERFQTKVNWKRMLKLFAESSRKTFIKNTLKRPSKRYGTVPGIKIRSKQKLLIALDTSGSIDENQLKFFFDEVYHIWKQSAEIMIVECDTIIQKEYIYKGQTPQMISGGGGTCFDAPIHYANTHYRPDSLIYFTDGFGPKPLYKSRCPILWMITSNGIVQEKWDFLDGRKIKMPASKA
ncbi:DUF2201 family putative metallopeptidase [Flavobacterium limi]|uniref:Metal-dependent peptidase n=1 Tax=Flavobacterium limi TaxID=2045105 RepID=A0ABQ1URI8_9FLAO|nr:VWA-like domain-containing protein [Flavobacterium limi]GGF23377.1 hypothetical protein GCM10011518_35850 [Flavobacterium limi]